MFACGPSHPASYLPIHLSLHMFIHLIVHRNVHPPFLYPPMHLFIYASICLPVHPLSAPTTESWMEDCIDGWMQGWVANKCIFTLPTIYLQLLI